MGRQLQLAPSNGVRAGRQGGARGPFSCMPKNEAMPGAQGAATSRSLHTAPAETTGARLAAIAAALTFNAFTSPHTGPYLPLDVPKRRGGRCGERLDADVAAPPETLTCDQTLSS